MSAAARQGFRVFLGNLPWTIGTTELRQFASSFGPVTYSTVIFDKKSGFSKGFGFISFGTREAYDAIIKGGNAGSYFLEGHYIHVTPSNNSPGYAGDE